MATTKLEVKAEPEEMVFLLATGAEARQIMRGSWRSQGECELRGIPTDWFYEPRFYSRVGKACDVCSVRQECLEYVLITHEPVGFWAGYTVNQRKPIYKQWLTEHAKLGTFPPGNHTVSNYRPQNLDRRIIGLIFKADNQRLAPDDGSMMNFLEEMLREKKRVIASRLSALERQGFVRKIWASKRRITAVELTPRGLDLLEADPSFVDV